MRNPVPDAVIIQKVGLKGVRKSDTPRGDFLCEAQKRIMRAAGNGGQQEYGTFDFGEDVLKNQVIQEGALGSFSWLKEGGEPHFDLLKRGHHVAGRDFLEQSKADDGDLVGDHSRILLNYGNGLRRLLAIDGGLDRPDSQCCGLQELRSSEEKKKEKRKFVIKHGREGVE